MNQSPENSLLTITRLHPLFPYPTPVLLTQFWGEIPSSGGQKVREPISLTSASQTLVNFAANLSQPRRLSTGFFKPFSGCCSQQRPQSTKPAAGGKDFFYFFSRICARGFINLLALLRTFAAELARGPRKGIVTNGMGASHSERMRALDWDE